MKRRMWARALALLMTDLGEVYPSQTIGAAEELIQMADQFPTGDPLREAIEQFGIGLVGPDYDYDLIVERAEDLLGSGILDYDKADRE